MKRFPACLVILFVAVVAMMGHYAQRGGTQGNLNLMLAVQQSECEISASFGHAVAYAENGSHSIQSVTANSHSPRSGFSTLSFGGRIPSPSFNGNNLEFRNIPVMGKPQRLVAKLYVLRV